jgi:hypothetical protein
MKDYSGEQMAAILVTLARYGYRPPAEVFDAFVKHVSDRADELSPPCTAALSEALTHMVPGYLLASGAAPEDGHLEYERLQMRLRRLEVPARIVSQPVPAAALRAAAAAEEWGGGRPAVFTLASEGGVRASPDGSSSSSSSSSPGGSDEEEEEKLKLNDRDSKLAAREGRARRASSRTAPASKKSIHVL